MPSLLCGTVARAPLLSAPPATQVLKYSPAPPTAIYKTLTYSDQHLPAKEITTQMVPEALESFREGGDQDVPIGNCGDPLRYPIPKLEGNAWDKLLQPLLEKDRQQCHAWKEEVENLLIFAGLFSAVVTAFLAETYKGLQPDSNDMMIALLTQIAVTLESSRNGTSTSSLPPLLSSAQGQQPSSGISRVNTLWFISLVLSLTDVLVGTVALQWIREHRRYPVQMTPRDKFAVFNMRREGLEAWHVPKVFSALPMILQVSLVLFLGGLIDFLLLIAPVRVLVPVIIFIVPPIVFLILTTIIPSLQWIVPPASFFKTWKAVPSECPYKSPQSFALSSILRPLLRYIYSVFHRDSLFSWTSFYGKPGAHNINDGGLSALEYRASCHEEEYKKKLIARADAYRTLSYEPRNLTLWHDVHFPVHDWIEGLYYAVVEGNSQVSIQEACYHCVQELAQLDNHSFRDRIAWLQYIQSKIDGLRHGTRTLTLARYHVLDPREVTKDVAIDELAITTLEVFRLRSAYPLTAAHIHERHLRLMKFYITAALQSRLGRSSSHITKINASRFYILSYYIEGFPPPPIVSTQYTELLKHLLTRASTIRISLTEITYGETTLPFFNCFISFVEIALLTQDGAEHLNTLQLMKSLALQYLLPKTSTAHTTYPIGLFFCMAVYCGELRGRYFSTKKDDVGLAMEELFVILSNFQKNLGTTKLIITSSPDSHRAMVSSYSSFLDGCAKIAADSNSLPEEPATPSVFEFRSRDEIEPDRVQMV